MYDEAGQRGFMLVGGYELAERFGVKIVAADGQTVLLDDRGILQTWQEGKADNVDQYYGLVLNV